MATLLTQRRSLPLLAFTLVVACGGDDPSGPSQVDVGGVWRMTFSNMAGTGVSCNSDPGNMSLTMSGATFSGTYGPMTVSCTTGSGALQDSLQGVVVNGGVSGRAVSFDLDSPDLHQTGGTSACLPGECDIPPPYSAVYMSGTTHWTIDLGGGQTASLNGTWSAIKQPVPAAGIGHGTG
jgi:hypothetical protein